MNEVLTALKYCATKINGNVRSDNPYRMRFTRHLAILASVALLVVIGSLHVEAQGTTDIPFVGGGSKSSDSTTSNSDKATGKNDASAGSAKSGDSTNAENNIGVTIPGAAVGGKVITSMAPAATVTVTSSARSAEGAENEDVNANSSSANQVTRKKQGSSDGSTLGVWPIVGICAGGLVALCAGLAAYSRWTRKGRNRRFEELQFGTEETYGAAQHPFAHRAYVDPFKKDLGAHHHGGYP
ncbi:hypothetical protein BDF22DRAFT_657489 [Syncephalis plumigaleata]|nr:hypothetical protein BDF22DRAFT_657489 [Syncephalis plumigaleata]